ncbi:hypothetical protein [Arcobacter arenosus]|uniref:hypothetical protein n=1 Tax=Arcobacter arenosus TaxID=2576037 RepID=UPI003BAA3811
MYRKSNDNWKSDFKINGIRYQKTWMTTNKQKALKYEEQWKEIILASDNTTLTNENDRISISQALKLLQGVDKLESLTNKPKSLKGFQLRTILLLIAIAQNEGENQSYYRDEYDWTFNSVSTHTRTLLEYGFIVQGDDDRDPRLQSKRLYLAEGVRELLEDELNIKSLQADT